MNLSLFWNDFWDTEDKNKILLQIVTDLIGNKNGVKVTIVTDLCRADGSLRFHAQMMTKVESGCIAAYLMIL